VSILSAGTSPQALLSRVLTASGVGRVLPFDSSMTSVVAAGAHSAAPRLVISGGAGDASQQRRELALDQWCQKAEVPWLRVTYRPREGRADIGPLFHRGPFPCCHCFHATQGNSAEDVDSSEGVSGDAAVWIGLAAFEATCILSRTAGALNGGGFRRYDVRTGERAEMSWCRVPGCPRCLPLRPANRSIVNAAEPRVHTPIAFEDAVAFHPSTEAISRTRRRVMADVEHGRYLKRLAVCRSLALPRAMPDMPFGISRALRGEMQPSDGRFGIEQLSTALRVTAGLRQFQQTDGPVSRWAPSAGNLGSPELFVAVRNIDGLPAGLYYYDAQDHSLTSLTRRHGGLLPDDLMARVLRRESDLPEALVIFTGAFHRIARKYGAFAYRLMHLDAGAAAVQLEVAAAALGAHSRVSAIWPDDLLQEQLQLQPIQEQVTAVVSLAARPLSQMRVGTSFAFGSAPSDRPITDFANWNAVDALECLVEESRVSEATLRRRVIECTDSPPQPVGPIARASVGEILRRRQSTRAFSQAAIPIATAAELIRGADDYDARSRLSDERSLTYQALSCDTIEATVFRFDRRSRQLVREGDAALPQAAVDSLYVQGECASAPLQIWILGDLHFACASAGAIGYRRLLFRAGAVAHHLSLAAAAADVEGTIVGGIKPHFARPLLGHDGYDEAPLVAFVGGRSRDG
jgi:SagB-type dehydrogenase family enzyme